MAKELTNSQRDELIEQFVEIQLDNMTTQDLYELASEYVTNSFDRLTGEVYKPASWKSPAKIVRFDLRLLTDRAKLHDPEFTTWAGGYLYLR